MRRVFSAALLLPVPMRPAWADPLVDFARAENITDLARFAASIAAIRRDGRLPPGLYITKRVAEALGWHPGADRCATAPGESLGGDRFDNREGALPRGAYHEADLDYHCGRRQAWRLVYDEAGHQWAIFDHYGYFQPVP